VNILVEITGPRIQIWRCFNCLHAHMHSYLLIFIHMNWYSLRFFDIHMIFIKLHYACLPWCANLHGNMEHGRGSFGSMVYPLQMSVFQSYVRYCIVRSPEGTTVIFPLNPRVNYHSRRDDYIIIMLIHQISLLPTQNPHQSPFFDS
jgi:hypothetical protein